MKMQYISQYPFFSWIKYFNGFSRAFSIFSNAFCIKLNVVKLVYVSIALT